MAVTSGFFNSRNGDRKYDARQVSELFDGVIGDGVFMHVGEGLQVFPSEHENEVYVGTGRCWFNHVWVKNWPSRLSVYLPGSDQVYMRYDAIVVEIDHTYRTGDITYVKGVASDNPALPTLKKEGESGVSQYPLAYVLRVPNYNYITSDYIEKRVGFSDCPWVVAPAGIVNLDSYWAKWEQQWSNWFTNVQDENETEFNEFLENKNTQYNNWQNEQGNEWANMKTELEAQTVQAVNASQEAIDGTLAGQLQKQIDELEFTNNMEPLAAMTMPNEYDTPKVWYETGSGYGNLTYDPAVGTDEILSGMIENFVSPYNYTSNSDGDELLDDKNGYFISQIFKTNSPKGLYVRTGYYRDPKYDETTTVEFETGWDNADNGNNGWREVSEDKVSKSGDTMTGNLTINSPIWTVLQGKRTIGEDLFSFHLETSPINGDVYLIKRKNGETENQLYLGSDRAEFKKPLSISGGGTGANNAANARENLRAMGAASDGTYWGLATPGGDGNNWIRTTANGIIPSKSGGASALGTSGWPFNNLYAKAIVPLGSSYAINDFIISSGTADIGGSTWAKYIKYYSGLIITNIYASRTGVSTQTSSQIDFPCPIYDPFIGGATVSQDGNSEIYVRSVARNGNASSAVQSLGIYAYNTRAGTNVIFNVNIMGRWK